MGGPAKMPCPNCTKDCAVEYSHRNTHGERERTYYCNKCTLKFKTVETYESHPDMLPEHRQLIRRLKRLDKSRIRAVELLLRPRY